MEAHAKETDSDIRREPRRQGVSAGRRPLTFATDVTTTQKQIVQLQYQPKKQVKISVVRDEYGGYGVDVRFNKVF